jgi:predicted dehydrogenase
MRLGLLSTARINGAILDAARETGRVDVVAVASREGARAQAYASEHGLERSHASYDALLADDAVDAIYVSLPNGLHHEWTLRSLAAGKHVLCEKPYSRRPAEVEEAWDAAEAAGLVVAEAFMYRHHPQTSRISELVHGGAVGRLRTVKATFSFPLGDRPDYRARPELGGGALMDVGCYCVSGARLLAGEPERVQAEEVTGETGIDLELYGQLRHRDGVVSQLEASFVAPRRQRLEAIGTEGTLVAEAPWRADWGGALLLERGDEVERFEVARADSFLLELEDFAAAVAGEAKPLLGREDALGQARAIDALFRAAETGNAVEL